MKVVRFIREVFNRYAWLLVGDVLLMVLEGLLGVIAVVTVAPVIDVFLSANPQQISRISVRLRDVMQSLGLPVSLGGLLGVFLAFQILKNAFAVLVRYCLVRTRYVVLRSLMLGTFETFFQARWAFFTRHKQGTLLNTFLSEIDAVGSAIGVMTLFFANLIQLTCYLAVPLWVSWRVTSISLAIAFLFAIPLLMLGRLNYRLARLGTATANQRSVVIQESFSLAKLILGFGHQDKSLRALAKAFDANRWVAHRFLTIQAATPLVYEPCGVIVLILTVFVGQRAGMSLSEIAVMLWALRNCIPLVGQLTTQRNALSSFVANYEQVQRLRDQARAMKQPSGALPFTGLRQEVRVEGLSFAYPGHEPMLMDINLSIPRGTMVALVGESGVGKSTLIDLIMGFHEPTEGRILIDGTPLKALNMLSYRRRIGYVPQDAVLFNATIRENLRWAKPDATEEEVRRACRQSNAEEFIERFPEGYDTVVGDRGVRLSGGQCQRMALARALLRQPELLILDEATSSLDSQSEHLIQRAIEAAAKTTTVIVIAHRLATIVNVDAIYVLHEGRIVEEGTYRTLRQQHGPFHRMTQLQLLEAAAR